MADPSYCPECGAPLPANWPKGLCSRCALQGALEMTGGESKVLHPIHPADAQQTVPLPKLTETSGTRIGRYKLLEQIGEGGFGVVWMAEQEEPVRRRVALKIIKLGMDTRQVIARFEAERQALAMMDHANIAKVLDAGATDAGRPFFVMELVKGIKITDYCDQNNLPTGERLDLFIKACHAIQHAHQKGIIHRDIKPSNVLVTLHDGVPVPKVIDFGIAKATEGRLTDKTLFTAFQQFIGTPAYVSPEQAEMSGLDIDTRSDIYSLGVLLYELLTGQTPFDTRELVSAGLDAIRRTLREVEPPRPSTRLSTLDGVMLTATARHRQVEPPRLLHQIRGDLDWIAMKCLEKDRTRRYETANGLAADLQRYLDNEPVVACPPSNLYRFQKLVRRNKLAFAASAAIAMVLVLGVFVSTWQAIRATRAEREQSRLREAAQKAQATEAELRLKAEADEKKAETEAARSAQVAQFMKEMLNGVGPSVALGRDTKLLREILDQTAQRVGKDLSDQPAIESELRTTLGLVYSALGEYEKAGDMQSQALAVRRKLHGIEHPEVAASMHNLSEVLRLQSKNAQAAAGFRDALAMRRKLLGNQNKDTAASLFGLAEVLRKTTSTHAEAEKLHREALAIRRTLLGNQDLEIASSLTGLAILLRSMPNRLDEAEKCLRESLEIQRKRLGDEHPEVAYTLMNLGYGLRSMPGRRAEAERLLRESIAMHKKLLGDHRDTAMAIHFLGLTVKDQAEAEALNREALAMRRKVLSNEHADVASSIHTLATLLRKQGRLEELEVLYREELAMRKARLDREDPALASSLHDLAIVLQDQGKLAEAEKFHREALAIQRKVLGEHPDTLSSLDGLANTLRNEGKLAELETPVREALSMRKKLLRDDDPQIAGSLISLGALLRTLDRSDEAQALYGEAAERLHMELPAEGHERANALNSLGILLNDQRNPAAAESVFREALAIQRKLSGNEDPGVAIVLSELGTVLRTQGKLDDAENSYRECLAIRESKLSDAWYTFYTRSVLGDALLGQKKYVEAEPLLLSGYEGMKQRKEKIGGEIGVLKAAIQRLVQLYEATSRPDQAAEWKKKLAEFNKVEGEKQSSAPVKE